MATVALSTLRSRVQTFLKDTDAKKWSADDVDTFINMAITQWTTDVPIASANSYTVVSSQHEYGLPENALSISNVYGYFESASNQEFLAPMSAPRPGIWNQLDEPRRYIVGFPLESQFYLPRLPQGSTFTLYYGASHTTLVNNTDTLDLRTHRWGEQAVIAYACYLAHRPYAASRARLEQWARKQDQNVGNPLQEQAQAWLEEYERLVDKYASPQVLEFVALGRA